MEGRIDDNEYVAEIERLEVNEKQLGKDHQKIMDLIQKSNLNLY